MKAKKYAAMYQTALAENARERGKALALVLHRFTAEMGELMKARGGSDAAALACFQEIEQKYHAFARLVSDEHTEFLPKGFRTYIQQVMPELWAAIQAEETRAQERRNKIEAWRKP